LRDEPGSPPGQNAGTPSPVALPQRRTQPIITEPYLTPTSGSALLDIIVNSSTISKIVLGILGIFSVVSWGIILQKWWTFRRTHKQTASFLDVFRRSNKFSEVQAVCPTLKESPLVGLFQAGYAEITTQLRHQGQMAPGADPANPAAANPRPGSARPTLKSLAGVDRALMRASVVEVNKLEKHIGFLATTAAITPFIGLFGTVIGIMLAFENIAQAGSTNLGVVSRPIADALIATACGLFAAIPAVYYYNLLTNRVKIFASEMDDFAMEFLNIAERNFT